jgi:hypothetical protein
VVVFLRLGLLMEMRDGVFNVVDLTLYSSAWGFSELIRGGQCYAR